MIGQVLFYTYFLIVVWFYKQWSMLCHKRLNFVVLTFLHMETRSTKLTAHARRDSSSARDVGTGRIILDSFVAGSVLHFSLWWGLTLIFGRFICSRGMSNSFLRPWEKVCFNLAGATPPRIWSINECIKHFMVGISNPQVQSPSML